MKTIKINEETLIRLIKESLDEIGNNNGGVSSMESVLQEITTKGTTRYETLKDQMEITENVFFEEIPYILRETISQFAEKGVTLAPYGKPEFDEYKNENDTPYEEMGVKFKVEFTENFQIAPDYENNPEGIDGTIDCIFWDIRDDVNQPSRMTATLSNCYYDYNTQTLELRINF